MMAVSEINEIYHIITVSFSFHITMVFSDINLWWFFLAPPPFSSNNLSYSFFSSSISILASATASKLQVLF
jgi:hypothetical protein